MHKNFIDETHYMQKFVRENIRLFGKYKIIDEQLYISGNERSFIDILAVDEEDNRIVIIELKNEYTSDKNSWQPLRYYDLLRRGEDELKKLLINKSIDHNKINLNPKVLLIVPKCNEQLLRALSYFEDVESKVIEVAVTQNGSSINFNKKTFYPSSIYHEEDLIEVNKQSKVWTIDEYKNFINREKVELAFRFINSIKVKLSDQIDVFPTKTKITLNKNGKVWCNVFIQQNPLKNNLTISFKVNKDKIINKNDFLYEHSIEKIEVMNGSVKLVISDVLPIKIIEKYFC